MLRYGSFLLTRGVQRREKAVSPLAAGGTAFFRASELPVLRRRVDDRVNGTVQ